jgi:ATP-dependent Clp protease ATP-binding subunit ClpA
MVSAAVRKLGHDSFAVLRELRRKTSRHKTQEKRKREAVAEEDEIPKKKTALERFGRDLTALAAAGALPPLIGRRAELVEITRILLQSRKNNLILIGEPGVGKTGVVEGFAQRMADGSLPEELGKSRVIEISLPSLVGRQERFLGQFFGISPSRDKCGGHRLAATGEFEERMEAVIHEASTEPRPILFIDEIHLLLGAGQAGGSMDAANILKPALARGAIRLIGAKICSVTL